MSGGSYWIASPRSESEKKVAPDRRPGSGVSARDDGNWLPHIVIVLYSLAVTGAARRMLSLAGGFAEKGAQVTLVTVDSGGGLSAEVPPGVEWFALSDATTAPSASGAQRKRRVWRSLPRLVALLRRYRPDCLLAGANHVHLVSYVAWRLTGGARPRLVLRVSNSIARGTSDVGGRSASMVALRRRAFRQADLLIAVSRDVALDAEGALNLRNGAVRTLPNPVVDPDLIAEAASQPVDHPWFDSGQPPVVLGVGRLHRQKDFESLIAAVARLRRSRDVRLVILGEGPEREALTQAAERHGVIASVDLPGQVANPFAYMRSARVTALSSRWEGMPGVLIEAMACGCSVVSTDCPGGSRDILADGALGPLVPVGDPLALADGLRKALDAPQASDALQNRAERYTVAAATAEYLEAINAVR